MFVGTEIGLLKGVNTTRKYFQNLNSINGLDRQDEILMMCWGNPQETEICCGLKNRAVKIYNAKSGVYNHALNVEGGEGPLRGLTKYNNHFLTCVESGTVQVWNENDEAQIKFEVGRQVYKMRQNPQYTSKIATGGKENDLKIWDIENVEKPVFKAKNVANDFLDHRVPVWITDMQFFPDSEKIIACTGYHHIRLYDPKTPQKRPVVNMEFDEYPLTALSIAQGENYVIVGNSRGRMGLFDLRKKLLVHCFKGFAGSIRSIQCHQSLPLVASCGLDRFLRIHDVGSHQLLHKVYLKSRLNCLLFRQEADEDFESVRKEFETCDVNQEMAGDEVMDELWEKMEEVKDDAEVVVRTVMQKRQRRTKRKTGISVHRIEKDNSVSHTKSAKKKRKG